MAGYWRLLIIAGLTLICVSSILGDTTAVPVDSAAATQVDTPAQTPSDSVAVTATQGGSSDEVQYPLSPERKAKLTAYSRFTNIWRFVDFIASLVIFCIFLYTGLSAKLRTWASSLKSRFLSAWIYLALFLVINYILSFPLSYYREFVVEGNYGFLNQTFMEWWLDGLKYLGLAILLGIVPMFFFYWVISRFKNWWLVFSLGAIPFMILMIVVAPVFISPLFNKFEPLQDKNLETQILTLASQAGIEGSNVFEVDASKQSEKVNAYVTGLFNTKRIVLFDTLIKNFTVDEIRFVMGHEMGHYVMNHMWIGLGLAIIFLIVALWLVNKLIHGFIQSNVRSFRFDRLEDFASLPLVMLLLTIILFVGQPIMNGASRSMEHQSDIYGMRITGVSGEVAATAFDKLSAYNLSDPDPNALVEFWFYSHPSLKKRMEFVRQFHP